jgi:hypothetical protein
MKCPHCKKEIEDDPSKWLYIPELKISVEIEVHDKNKSWDELNLSKREKELLTVEQCIWLANSKYAKKLKMDGSSSKDDFFIQQPFNLNRENNYPWGKVRKKIKGREQMIKKKCKYCPKVIEGHTESQVEHLMKQHLISKHSDKVDLKEKKDGNK